MNLFVAGCPRSGTTVLTRLLNLHPDIVIGLERYKLIYGRSKQITPGMLKAENFFDFKPTETSYTPASSPEAAQFYEQAKAKFSGAKFIGDKYPQFFRFYRKLFQNFPEAKVVFIVRDPVAVAQSWQRRSEDSSSWPEKNDARRSISYWNDSLAYTLAYTRVKKDAFVFIEYEELFRLKQQGLIDLFLRIGAEVTPAIREQVAGEAEMDFCHSEEISARKIELTQDGVDAIQEGADHNLLLSVRRIIRADRKRLNCNPGNETL